jgi:Mn2+/Fe2+ NRAMP family transporter
MIMNFNPIRALYWSAVINGVVAVPVMAIMMWLATMPKVMGEFAVTGWVKTLGWAATVVMALRLWRCWRHLDACGAAWPL